MRHFWGWALAFAALLLVAMVASLPTTLGASLWHYNVGFAGIGLAAVLAWRSLRSRRIATLLMASSGLAATATGFAMLYTVQFPYKDWLTWWHSVTSAVLVAAFLAHWANNHPRLSRFVARLFARDRRLGVGITGVWTLILVAGIWTWGPADARALFTRDSYLHLASWAVLGGVILAYGPWLAYRLPAMRARLAEAAHRDRARALLDTSLFLAHWGALLTGFALVWWATPLRAGDLKYVSKWWHTATSVAFLALVALHIGFNANLLRAHARRVDRELRG